MASIAQRGVAPNQVPALQSGLKAKLRRLAIFPGLTILARLRIAQWLHARRTAAAAKRLADPLFAPLLAGRDPDALPQDPADLLYLYETVASRPIERAIEFGSGQSTLFIAQAMYEKRGGHLWSLDANERWLAATDAAMPEHLKPYVTLVHSPVEITDDFGVPAWRYQVIPEGNWDFVMMDGPEHLGGATMTTNLIELAERLNPGATGFIDHRMKTAVLTKVMAGDKLDIRYMPSLESFEISERGAPVRLLPIISAAMIAAGAAAYLAGLADAGEGLAFAGTFHGAMVAGTWRMHRD